MLVNVGSAGAYVALATIQGGLVALPSPVALDRLRRLRSPAWALAAPAAIVIGTFGVLALPALATALAVLAAIGTPVLAAIAVVSVVHGGKRVLLLVPLGLGAVVAAASGFPAEVAASLLTALGCLTLGAAFVRLTPARWLHVGLLAMGMLDVLLLALGLGQQASALFTYPFSAPAFHQAEVGGMSIDYPDLVLAAVLGGVVAGRAIQGRAAVLVAMLASAYGGLFAVADMLPATVPLIVVLVLVELHSVRSRTRAKPIGREPGRVEAGRADRTVLRHGLRLEAHSDASRHDRPRCGRPASSSVQGGGGGPRPARR
jgi:hypothetical protein